MKILIVDDEKISRLNISRQLDSGFTIQEASSFAEAQAKLHSTRYDLCFIDLKLDNSKNLIGLDLIALARAQGCYTVVLSAIDNDEITEIAYDRGCQDVFNKGKEKEHVSSVLNRYFLAKDNFTLEHMLSEVIPTQNKAFKDELKRLLRVVPTEIPICLLGESGTGKSHLARAIHHLSKRKGYFVEINCAALTGDTLRSELFGHTKGSFTGAVSDTVGKLSHAHNGTLFLDEIGSMSFDMQEALLKAIEEKSYYPIGSNKLVKSDFRVISATLDNLEAKIRTGKFRFDLFQRISGYTMTQPKLSDRKEDILPFLKNKLQGKRKILFKEEARKFLETYQWPGNLRELSNFAELISQSESSVIQLDEVKAFLRISKVQSATSLLTDEQYNRIKEVGLREFMDQLSMEIMEMALEENQHVATKAIAELKISTATFYKYSRKDGDLKNNPDISGAVS